MDFFFLAHEIGISAVFPYMRKCCLTNLVPTCGKHKNNQPHAGSTSIRDVIVMLKCHMYVASQRIQELLDAFNIKTVINGEQENESIILVRMIKTNPSFVITVCRYLASILITLVNGNA